MTGTALLAELIALNPRELADVNAGVRGVAGAALGLTALRSDGDPRGLDPAVAEFAEQFAVDVSVLSPAQRAAFAAATGDAVLDVTALIFIADFAPRVLVALSALDVPVGRPEWDRDCAPADVLLNGFAPAVGRMRELDPVTSELVRLRGARAHNCRLCKSLREGAALDAGGDEAMYDAIDRYEQSDLSERHKAALRYVDALIWTPQRPPNVLGHFGRAEAVELTLDVMRNACNKIAVALGFDEPRVPEGTERYLLGADGQPVYS